MAQIGPGSDVTPGPKGRGKPLSAPVLLPRLHRGAARSFAFQETFRNLLQFRREVLE